MKLHTEKRMPHCCDTNEFYIFRRKVYKTEHTFLPKQKCTLSVYVMQLCRKIIIAQFKKFVKGFLKFVKLGFMGEVQSAELRVQSCG